MTSRITVLQRRLSEGPADNDPLMRCDVDERTESGIIPISALRESGIDCGRDWYSSAPRQTSHISCRVVLAPEAKLGEVTRMEIYKDRQNPTFCFFVLYRIVLNEAGEEIIETQFFTNDPAYAARHKWMGHDLNLFTGSAAANTLTEIMRRAASSALNPQDHD